MKDKPLDNKRFSRDVIAAMLLASFVRPPEVVLFFIVIGVSRGWLKMPYVMPSHAIPCVDLLYNA